MECCQIIEHLLHRHIFAGKQVQHLEINQALGYLIHQKFVILGDLCIGVTSRCCQICFDFHILPLQLLLESGQRAVDHILKIANCGLNRLFQFQIGLVGAFRFGCDLYIRVGFGRVQHFGTPLVHSFRDSLYLF